MTPSPPPLGLPPSKEQANARAAAQLHMEDQRSRHALSARRRNCDGSERGLASANNLMKVTVSADQRPATSPTNTTNLARARGPQVPGKCVLCADVLLATQLHRWWLHWALVLHLSTKQRQGWCRSWRGRPSATTSNRRSSITFGARQKHLSTLWHLLPCKFGQRHSPGQNLVAQALLLCCMLRGGGQKNRADGHTGRCERQEAKANEGVGEAAHERGLHQCVWNSSKVQQPTPLEQFDGAPEAGPL